MRRIGAIFIAVCMMLIAASIGAVLYLGFKIDASTSAIMALAALTAMALFNSISNRLRDRGDLRDQIGDLSRGTADLARQVAEEVRNHFGAKVYQSVVPRNVRLGEAPSFGKPIILYDIRSRGSEAYINLAKEFIQRAETGRR